MEKSFSRLEAIELEAAMGQVLNESVPGKYAINKTLKRISKINRDTLDKRHDVFDTHVKKKKGTPELKKDAKAGPNGYLLTDYVFKDNEKFEVEMNEMLEEEVKVEIHEMNGNSKVLIPVSRGNSTVKIEMTLEEYLNSDGEVSPLAVSILSEVFIK